MFRNWLTYFFAIAFSTLSVSAGAQSLNLNYFTATPDGSDVLVQWEVPDESGLTEFRLFRKIESEPDFVQLTSIQADGSRSYQFVDYTLFRGTPKTVNYRLQVYKNGMVYSYYANIMYNPTSVQRTWGSIKAMFK